jgi:hypothetical protein
VECFCFFSPERACEMTTRKNAFAGPLMRSYGVFNGPLRGPRTVHIALPAESRRERSAFGIKNKSLPTDGA